MLTFVDLETTGATASVDRITEIGMVLVDTDGSVRQWQQLVNPGIPIPPFIQQLTGITPAMVADAPSFADIADTVHQLLAGRRFIAHNATFDYNFIKTEFARLGMNFRARVLCTVKLSRALFPEFRQHKLDALIERHGLQAEARHRALADAQLIHQFWDKIHDRPGPEAVSAALQTLDGGIELPAHLVHLENELPETVGVYVLYGADDQALFVGQGKDLSKRVLRHFATLKANARQRRLAAETRRIEWFECSSEAGSRVREMELLRTLRPPFNQNPGRR